MTKVELIAAVANDANLTKKDAEAAVNSALTAMADRVIRVKNGTVCGIETNEHPMDIAEIEW